MNKSRIITFVIRLIGIALVTVGLVAAYYGPMEIYVFQFFSRGGQFEYDGFGFGSLWFAALVLQNLGYYVIAAVCIPVGIAHITLRRWGLTLARLFLYFWVGAGILLLGNLLALLPNWHRLGILRSIQPPQLTVMSFAAFIFLLLLPLLALAFYQAKAVTRLFQESDPRQYWTELYPFPLLALILLFLIMILVLHLAIFFQAVFPLFGQVGFGRPMVYIISGCILVIGILIYGTARLQKWVWWSSLGFVSLLTVTTILSFAEPGFYDLILRMDLPAFEMEFLDRMVAIHDMSLVGWLAPPLLAALVLILISKRHFQIESMGS